MKRIYVVSPGLMRQTANLWVLVPDRNVWYLQRRYRMMRKAGISETWARYMLTDLLIMGTNIKFCENYGHVRKP